MVLEIDSELELLWRKSSIFSHSRPLWPGPWSRHTHSTLLAQQSTSLAATLERSLTLHQPFIKCQLTVVPRR